jgi:hypothetical protein
MYEQASSQLIINIPFYMEKMYNNLLVKYSVPLPLVLIF